VFLPFFFSWAGMFFWAYLKYNALAAKKQQKKEKFSTSNQQVRNFSGI